MILFLIVIVVLLLLGNIEDQRQVYALKKLALWNDKREVFVVEVLRPVRQLAFSNAYHKLPGEYEVNFQTLRAMWENLNTQEQARRVIFGQFKDEWAAFEEFEKNNPVPRPYVPLLVMGYRRLRHKPMWTEDDFSRH